MNPNSNSSNSNKITRRQILALAGTGILASTARAALPDSMPKNDSSVWLSDLDLGMVDQGWNVAKANRSVKETPLIIAGRAFDKGVGTVSSSRIAAKLGGKTARFTATVGVDDSAGAKASLAFVARGDGRELFRTPVMKRGDAAVPVDLNVANVDWLTLHVEDGGDGSGEDHADWADAKFEGVSQRPKLFARLPAEENLVLPGKLWLDTTGARIQAHGGGLMRHEGKWWWHGENRALGYIAPGVSAYYSTDLQNWTPVGLVLKRTDYDKVNGDKTLCERPKVLFNPRTKKFVMWFHYDRSGYGDSRAGIAVADSPAGPFQFLGAIRPIESSTFRDMNFHLDSAGNAYAFYSGEGNQTMHVVRLNAEWTAPEMPMVEGKTWNRILIRGAREAPAPFEHAGKTYLFTSGTSGWAPNRADLAVADNPLGPYRSLGDPCIPAVGPENDAPNGVPEARLTFRSQPTYVLPRPGGAAGEFIYMGDRWKPESLGDSRYVWLPFQMPKNPETEKVELKWQPSWSLI